MQITFLYMILGALLFAPVTTVAQTAYSGNNGIYKATITEAGASVTSAVEGTNAVRELQVLTVVLTEGPAKGVEAVVENEFTRLAVGDTVYIQYITDITGVEYFYLFEIERETSIWFLLGLFAVVLILFGGAQGVRALAALGLGLLAIMYILVPGLLAGYSPVLVSVVVAATILFLALMFTHGVNRGTLIAFGGTVSAVVVTGFLAVFAIDFVHLTGIPSETEWYLALNTDTQINMLGLLLGGIIIGVLGALDDIAITQVATVRELYALDNCLPAKDVYVRAMRVGKAHVGSLVNTLALAYTGASLPLILLFANNAANTVPFANLEVFATEIVRILISSIGLILTVPITTVLAAYFIRGNVERIPDNLHSHGHSH